MNQILVTGGLGYIGSHTVIELLAAGYEPGVAKNAGAHPQDGIDAESTQRSQVLKPGFSSALHQVDHADHQARSNDWWGHPAQQHQKETAQGRRGGRLFQIV